MSVPTPARPAQLAFAWDGHPADDPEQPLYDVTFVVVDLETTGTSPDGDAITEIGAVKVRGGKVLGEFATLVNPGCAIPPKIVQVTGITTAMLIDAPRIESVLPGFLEFAAGAVLVAHNARFDTSFLKAAAARSDTAWPDFPVVCTVRLARRVLDRDEAPTVQLGMLAQILGSRTRPTHRALDDARATVDVLHALIERVGNVGVHTLEDLVGYLPAVTRRQREKRSLAAHLPTTPGVYLFRGPGGEVLYIGTAKNLRRRVHSYFTGSDPRARMKEMVALATRVDHVECAHALEAGVRELRLLVAHTPPYNRRSKFPQRAWWLVLSEDAFPRLTVTRTPAPDALGPFNSRTTAAELAVVVAEHCGLRTCSTRIRRTALHGADCAAVRAETEPRTERPTPTAISGAPSPELRDDPPGSAHGEPCAPGPIPLHGNAITTFGGDPAAMTGRAPDPGEPCTAGPIPLHSTAITSMYSGCPAAMTGRALDSAEYAHRVRLARDLFSGRDSTTLRDMTAHIETFSTATHFEAAARLRDRTVTVVRAVRRTQRLAALARIAEFVAARSDGAGGWEFAVVRYGRLAAAGTAVRGIAPMPVVDALVASAETVLPDGSEDARPPLHGAPAEETGLVLRWLEQPGTRIVTTSDGYYEPLGGAGAWLAWADRAESARQTAVADRPIAV